ncbi:hypothetical protein FHL15_005152 [Xylaria flabelliformis]|uniref:Uncharacterized protein n=1 Tax=Xylaria flabelliformis TaxID=2512241 RepID=A0A553I1K1_9PEZI|nr:hypothetical protein FHL15_005152 [Xylaria flabelliformis]
MVRRIPDFRMSLLLKLRMAIGAIDDVTDSLVTHATIKEMVFALVEEYPHFRSRALHRQQQVVFKSNMTATPTALLLSKMMWVNWLKPTAFRDSCLPKLLSTACATLGIARSLISSKIIASIISRNNDGINNFHPISELDNAGRNVVLVLIGSGLKTVDTKQCDDPVFVAHVPEPVPNTSQYIYHPDQLAGAIDCVEQRTRISAGFANVSALNLILVLSVGTAVILTNLCLDLLVELLAKFSPSVKSEQVTLICNDVLHLQRLSYTAQELLVGEDRTAWISINKPIPRVENKALHGSLIEHKEEQVAFELRAGKLSKITPDLHETEDE